MRLRFSIRDLLWLIMVIALAFGWWHDQRTKYVNYLASEGAWAVAVGKQPFSVQEELRKAHQEAYDRFRGRDAK